MSAAQRIGKIAFAAINGEVKLAGPFSKALAIWILPLAFRTPIAAPSRIDSQFRFRPSTSTPYKMDKIKAVK